MNRLISSGSGRRGTFGSGGGSGSNINLQWLPAVVTLWDATTSLPGPTAIGESYIASATGNGWIINRVYTWNGSTWSEHIPVPGDVTFVIQLEQVWYWSLYAYPDRWVPADNIYLRPVIVVYDNTSGLPSNIWGSRYIAKVTAHGWTTDRIYESDGIIGWIETIPDDGSQVWAVNTRKHYLFTSGGGWQENVYYGTGAAPSAAGLVDGTLFFKYV